jgi:nitroimidazol reductase NimA-like FMN-containing flavoprotein (pyridoxamine 5'-phosphate oxidase superfamily)
MPQSDSMGDANERPAASGSQLSAGTAIPRADPARDYLANEKKGVVDGHVDKRRGHANQFMNPTTKTIPRHKRPIASTPAKPDLVRETQMTRRVEALTVSECRELLKEYHFGRLAFVDAVGVLPVIIPVNYLLDEDTVAFRTDAGSKLGAAVRGAPVAFEVDGVDQDRQVGWSVVIRGRAEVVTDPVKLADLRQSPLVAWHPRANQRYVHIKPSQVIGRRIAIADLPPNWWG